MWRFPPRAAVGVAVFLLGILDLNALSLSIRSHTRLRETTVRNVREAVIEALPHLRTLMEPGGAAAWEQTIRDAVGRHLATEAGVFSPGGGRLYSFPRPFALGHWPLADEMALVRKGNVLTLGPLAGEDYRVVTYVSLPSGEQALVLRLSAEVPDLVADLRERRELMIGHGLALLVLVLAGALLTAPSDRPGEAGSPRALRAYEEAMERLREKGAETNLRHEEERRRLGEQIQDKEAMARAGELASGIAHEVRNGLGTILGYARLLERDSPTSQVLEAARSIREECETLETVVRRFIDFVKREDLHLARFDVARMLSRVVGRESRSRPGGEVTMTEVKSHELVGDEEVLERAFENLVRNAREAAGPAGRVWISALAGESGVVVSVEDDGPGLSPELRDGVRPFFTTKVGGLGLGLPLAIKIVHLHGGDLALSSRSPRGAVVTVRLPRGY